MKSVYAQVLVVQSNWERFWGVSDWGKNDSTEGKNKTLIIICRQRTLDEKTRRTPRRLSM